MKKTTKPTKAPAPASRFTAPTPAPKPSIAPKIKKPPASAGAPTVLVKPKGSRVSITAKIDIGFGNSLFIRGGGAGLSWGKGSPLSCTSGDTWTVVLSGV